MRAILSVFLFLLPMLGNALSSFTPESMLSAPRRSSATPNAAGTHAIFTSGTYSFDTHDQKHGLWLLDITTGVTSLLSDEPHVKDACWLGIDEWVAYLDTNPKSYESSLWVTSTAEPYEKYKVVSFSGPVTDLKMVTVDEKMVHFVVSGKAVNGELYNPKTAKKRYTSGLVFTSGFARHWDEWVDEDRNSLFSGHLIRADDDMKRFTINEQYPLKNLLQGSKLESPVPPFGGKSDYTISPDGKWVAFVAKDPELNPAMNTASYVYMVPHSGEHAPIQVNKGGGASSSPSFSKDGETLAFLQMDKNGYEADKNKIYLANAKPDKGHFTITQVAKKWDRSPGSITWSRKSNYLYLVAENHGKSLMWSLAVIYAGSGEKRKIENGPDKPLIVTDHFSVSAVKTLGSSEWCIVSGSSLTSPTFYGLVNPVGEEYKLLSSAPERHEDMEAAQKSNQTVGTFAGFQRSQVDETWFKGAGDYDVHALIVKPSFFEKGKRYPLAFFIHGGPQSAWGDSWSTRWNMLVFAEQGYVCVAVNPTGSTGYGQDFVDAIAKNWGGRPYKDLELAFEHIKNSLHYVNTDRSVALGASYGGYMINWVQGHSLGRKFKALVCHDGVTNLANQWSSDELYFPEHDMGPIFGDHESYEKWNPFNHIKEWKTPQMIIHSMLDFRLPMSEGVMAYNILQSAGVDTKFLIFPDENHWVLKPENSLKWHDEVLEFINRYAKPENPLKEKKSSRRGEPKNIKEEDEDEPKPKLVTQGQDYL